MTDPDDDTERRRLFGTPKNNLGRNDLPTLGFVIESDEVPTDEGPADTGQLQWGKDAEISIFEAMRRAAEGPDKRGAAEDAAEWLETYLRSKGGKAESYLTKEAAGKAKISDWALRRARERLKVRIERDHDFGSAKTWWLLPEAIREAIREDSLGESLTTNTNGENKDIHGGRVGGEDPRANRHKWSRWTTSSTTTKFSADGLGFRGVIEEEHLFVGARDSARPGHSMAAADDAGNRCRMVRVAVGRSGDELVDKVEAAK